MSIQTGDRVEVKVVGNVQGKDGKFLILDNGVYLHADTPGINFRKLPRPKPRAGDVLTGRQIAETPLRRGTIIRFAEDVSALVLGADGEWHEIDTLGQFDHTSYSFKGDCEQSLNPDAKFTVLHVA